MRGLVFAMVAACASGAAADVWNPREFYAGLGNPQNGATQDDDARWTFRHGAYDGTLLTGLRDKLPCKQGVGLWGRADDQFYGCLPCVGPRTSTKAKLNQCKAPNLPEFDGLTIIPLLDDDRPFLVFTADGPVAIPTLTLRCEMLYLDYGNGVRVTVKTLIAGKTKTLLNEAEVPPVIDGFQEWTLFENDHPQMQAGDKLWIEMDTNANANSDWLNLSLTSSECYPDCDGNGALDLFDFLCFVNGFNAGDENSDCDGNGARDLFDFLCFVNAFNAGC